MNLEQGGPTPEEMGVEEPKTFNFDKGDVENIQSGLQEYVKLLLNRLNEERKVPVERQHRPQIDFLEQKLQEVGKLQEQLRQ